MNSNDEEYQKFLSHFYYALSHTKMDDFLRQTIRERISKIQIKNILRKIIEEILEERTKQIDKKEEENKLVDFLLESGFLTKSDMMKHLSEQH